jgi:adenosylmethionine-8-amino-7-oxononanoate aminotransferase
MSNHTYPSNPLASAIVNLLETVQNQPWFQGVQTMSKEDQKYLAVMVNKKTPEVAIIPREINGIKIRILYKAPYSKK